MKMKKTPVTLCSSTRVLACVPEMNLADVNFMSQNTSAASSIPASALQQLIWTPADQSKTQSVNLTTGGQRLDIPGVVGPVTAWNVPANIGELALTPDSELSKHKQVFAPNVLILDQNMTPAAFFPSSYFIYQQPSVMTADRLGGVIRLTPAPGQQKLYVLMFTTGKSLRQTMTLLNPAKAHVKGASNAAPDVPDPIAKRTTDDVLKLKAKTNNTSSVLVGPLPGSSDPGPVTVGNTTASVTAPAVAAAAVPAARSEPVLSDTGTYFNNGIKQAVKQGDVDKVLKLVNEAKCLDSKSARSTFINNVKGKG